MDNDKNKSRLSFPVMFQKIEDVDSGDERFTRVKIWLMHLGQNFNGSVFEKEVVDAAIPTLQYIPIVGFIVQNSLREEDFTQHKYVMIRTVNGKEQKYLGRAYGVILSNEDNNAHYEERLCDDGITRTFLVVDGVIWNMFEDAADIMQRDLVKPHSMELWDNGIDSFDGCEDEDGLFHFTRFSFRAACILGKDYESGMNNSTIEVQFSMCDFVKSMQNELNHKYTAFSKAVKINEQGGKSDMPNGKTKTDFSQTVFEQLEDISNIVSTFELMQDRWGDAVPRFYLRDIQDNEVIVVDKKNNYQVYGMPFTLDGDKPVIDFTSAQRKKTRYENYEDGSDEPKGFVNFGKIVSDIDDSAAAKVDEANQAKNEAIANYNKVNDELTELKTNFEKVQTEYDKIKPKYDEYVRAEKAAAAAAVTEQKNTLFKKFDSHLSDMTEYAA
ncbi:MAG: hypothetical protein ACI4RF_05520, partial [Eubacterium sp.]